MQDNENEVIVRVMLNLLPLEWRDNAQALIFMTIFSNKLAIHLCRKKNSCGSILCGFSSAWKALKYKCHP